MKCANLQNIPSPALDGLRWHVPAGWLNDYGWDWFTVGQYGLALELEWFGRLPPGAEIRWHCDHDIGDVVSPEDSAWQTLVAGSNYGSFDFATASSEFTLHLWPQVRAGGVTRTGPELVHVVTV